jgi:poly(3-hydroxybutyrate) depolymerase
VPAGVGGTGGTGTGVPAGGGGTGTSPADPSQGVDTAGTNSGGAGTGGAQGSGGATTGAGAAGEQGQGGTPVEGPVGSSDDVAPSAGCGQDPPASDRYSIDVGDLTREYIINVPDGYDPNNPYRLIFTWHPWGGSAQQVAGNGPNGYYGLLGASGGEAILVSPEGLDFGGNGLGWGNENGQDMDFLRAMMDRFDSELCFDHNRVFSTGFSFGGMMSNAVGCAGLARAVAPMAGNSTVSGCESGSQPVAYMGFHGTSDSVVAISGGQAARDVFVGRNGCGAEMPSDSNWCDLAGSNFQPCNCMTYDGCQEGYPVTWCEYKGDHMVAPNSGQTIWDFFAQF